MDREDQAEKKKDNVPFEESKAFSSQIEPSFRIGEEGIKIMTTDQINALFERHDERSDFMTPECSHIIIPKTKDEVEIFHKSVAMWFELTRKLKLLAQNITEFEEKDKYVFCNDDLETNYQLSSLEKTLKKELELIEKGLTDLDIFIHEDCDYYRSFPLNSGDSLWLIYQSKPSLTENLFKGVYFHDNQAYLLDSDLFPIELKSVKSLEHFTALLKNAHITLSRDDENPSKSTFSITQGCKGGASNPMVLRGLIVLCIFLVFKIDIVLLASQRALESLGIFITENTLRTMIAGILIGVGCGALVAGCSLVLPFTAVATGLAVIARGSLLSRILRVCRMIEEILSRVSSSLRILSEIRDLYFF